MKNHPKNNYAFEIRFVDDKTVQVFDIAAKNKQEGSGLPTEYDEEEVLRGQLRYSKLLGSTPSSNKLGDIHDDGKPYEHKVITKRSKNRRSIQRHTFFMMGSGGDGGGEDSLAYNYDSEESDDCIKDVKPTLTNYKNSEPCGIVAQALSSPPSSPPSPTPSAVPLTSFPPPTIPQAVFLPSPEDANLVMEQPSSIKYHDNTYNMKIQNYKPSLNTNQVSPIIPPPPQTTSISIAPPILKPAYTTLQNDPQKSPNHQYYTEDYTSIVLIDSNDCDSRRNIQRQESNNQEKQTSSERSCCIIS